MLDEALTRFSKRQCTLSARVYAAVALSGESDEDQESTIVSSAAPARVTDRFASGPRQTHQSHWLLTAFVCCIC